MKLRLWSDLYLIQGRYIVIMGAPNKTSSPVSYTHLDVYKRQQYYGLKSVNDNHVLYYAPNNWKTKRGAINWAKKNGYEVEE